MRFRFTSMLIAVVICSPLHSHADTHNWGLDQLPSRLSSGERARLRSNGELSLSGSISPPTKEEVQLAYMRWLSSKRGFRITSADTLEIALYSPGLTKKDGKPRYWPYHVRLHDFSVYSTEPAPSGVSNHFTTYYAVYFEYARGIPGGRGDWERSTDVLRHDMPREWTQLRDIASADLPANRSTMQWGLALISREWPCVLTKHGWIMDTSKDDFLPLADREMYVVEAGSLIQMAYLFSPSAVDFSAVPNTPLATRQRTSVVGLLAINAKLREGSSTAVNSEFKDSGSKVVEVPAKPVFVELISRQRMRRWIDRKGNRVKGKLKRVGNEEVIILLSSGKLIQVTRRKLSDTDQSYIANQALVYPIANTPAVSSDSNASSTDIEDTVYRPIKSRR